MVIANLFAKKGTKQRALVCVKRHGRDTAFEVMDTLGKVYGGDWVTVEHLQLGDVVLFESEDEYNGFDGREDDNYCRGSLMKSFIK